MREFLFSYDDICLSPEYSELPSRSLADTTINFLNQNFKIPIVPANMEDVISIENAKFLAKNKYFYIMHRFNDAWKRWGELDKYMMSISIGVKDTDKTIMNNLIYTPYFITIDVAHAHHANVKNMIDFLKNSYRGETYENTPKIIVGNVATADGYKFLCDCGADAVKVGIGGGSICTTRYKTGFHTPTAYSVWDCANHASNYDIPIIADGGAKHFGDVAKALALGADMVMSGRWFAECIDSPAFIRGGKKVYRGSTSYEMKGHNNHVEGQTLEIDRGCTYEERLREITQALQSGISYAGGNSISALKKAKWHLYR
jgi:GMP reductase